MQRLFLLLISISVITTLAACREEEPVVVMTFTPSHTAVTPTNTTQPTQTPTIPRPTSTTRPYPTPSLTPSITPTSQPTSTPTSTLLPDIYLTPSTPAAEAAQYRLVPWTADYADNLGRLMESYSGTVSSIFPVPILEGISNSQYYFSAIAYREALLRYPDDPRAGRWLLAEIINEAHSGENNEKRFREVIVEALNEGETSFVGDELVTWFDEYPSFFNIQFEEIAPPPEYKSAYVVTLTSTYAVGGMVALILEDENEYSSRLVFSDLGNYFAATSGVQYGDLTNDGMPEVIVSAGNHNGSMIYTNIYIYDLSQSVPRQLGFEDRNRLTPNRVESLTVVTSGSGPTLLQIEGGEDFACPTTFIKSYAWNGQWFELSKFEITSQQNDFLTCIDTLNVEGYWWTQLDYIEREAILNRIESEFDLSNPPTISFSGEPNPADYKDKVRYILAMTHAVLGHVNEAQEYLNLIQDEPSIPESSWLEPARAFLDNYQAEEDTYRACLAAGHCDLVLSLERTVKALPKSDYGDIIGRLSDLGATVHNSGTFDFDNDGSAETWAVLSGLPGEPLELWLFAETAEGIVAEFIADTTTLFPNFNQYTPTGDELFRSEPLYDYIPFTTGTGEIYSFVRHPTTGEPFVTHLAIDSPFNLPESPDPLRVEFGTAVSDLFAGADPLEIAGRISAVINNPAFTPTNKHYYYLGLAYELAGDEPNAVAAYLLAWKNCCDGYTIGPEDITTANPYAIMAQAKLKPVD